MRTLFILGAALMLSVAHGGPPAQYTITTIDYPGFTGTTSVTGINDGGVIVGAFSVPNTSYSYGFSDSRGKYSLLPAAPCRTSHCDNTPLAINSRGDIAGEFSDSIEHRAVFVVRRGTLQLIDVPSPSNLALFGGLNERGDVAGYFQDSSGIVRMFVYSGSTFTELPVPSDFVDVAAKGINNGGQITGIYDDATGLHGFLEKNGRFTRLDVPGGVDTNPVAINEPGDIVGYYSVAGAKGALAQHGFLLSHGRFSNIDVPGGLNTMPSVLNNAGAIAGSYEDPTLAAPFNTRAFALQHGSYVRLSLPGAVQSVAGITTSGVIVGTYFDASCPFSCSVHGFRATPGRH